MSSATAGRDMPWVWEVFPANLTGKGYRWLITNILARDDDTGVEIRYRYRRPDDSICGARTTHPGFPDLTPGVNWRGYDPTIPHEVVCTVAEGHAEMPHVGVAAACADMVCSCWERGCDHLVIVGFGVSREPSMAGQWAGRHG